ncbi:MAG: arginase family protein, partial [bacterium]|nr:arginase family protein [bacterium]
FSSYWNIAEHADFPEIFQLKRKPRGKVHYQNKVAKVADLTAAHTRTSLCLGHLPIVFGGDHSVAIGSCRGALEFALSQSQKLGLLWIDAHHDAHTHVTTRSHHANGMPLAVNLGFGPRVFLSKRQAFLPEQVLHIGAGETDCEPEERTLLEGLGVPMISAKEFRQLNLVVPWTALMSFLDRVDLVWVSFDLDVANYAFAPGVHLRSTKGLARSVLLWIAGHVAISGKLYGADIMEYKPSAEEYDEDGVGKTMRLASDFLLRLLGR